MPWLRLVATFDLRALAWMRMGLALVILGDLLDRWTYINAHYSDVGVLPRDFMHRILWEPSYFCIHAWSGSAIWQHLLFGLAAGFAFMLLLGYRTRLMTILTWLLLISLHNRNQYLLNGGDQLLRLVLFWSMFLPLGSRYSLDAKSASNSPSNAYFSIANLGFLLQLAWMYFASGLSKAMAHDYSFVNVKYMTDLAGPLFNVFLALPDYFAGLIIGVQLVLPFLLFSPYKNHFLRFLFIVSFALFHLANLLFFRLGVFSWIGFVSLLAIIPSVANESPSSLKVNSWKQGFMLFLIAYLLLINTVYVSSIRLPRFLLLPAYTLRLDQRWNMFSGESMKQAVLVNLEGKSEDGSEFALSDPYARSLRWRNYLYYSPFIHEAEFNENLTHFVCKHQKSLMKGNQKLVSLSIVYTRFVQGKDSLVTNREVIFECACN
jgi:hypothetical protein